MNVQTPKMKPPRGSDAFRFFWEYAGYSYDPKKETESQGRTRCARQLVRAEKWLKDNARVEWCDDPHADRSHMEQDDGRPFFGCIVHRVCAACGSDVKNESESLWGIDLGETGNECDEYKRVVAAELALEMMPE